MSLKPLVNDKPLWDAFLEEVDSDISRVQTQLEQCANTDEMFRLQGEIRALRRFKFLRQKINGPE